VNAGAYLPEADLPKLKTIFWHNNIMAFAPVLEVPAKASLDAVYKLKSDEHIATEATTLLGMWSSILLPFRMVRASSPAFRRLTLVER